MDPVRIREMVKGCKRKMRWKLETLARDGHACVLCRRWSKAGEEGRRRRRERGNSIENERIDGDSADDVGKHAEVANLVVVVVTVGNSRPGWQISTCCFHPKL